MKKTFFHLALLILFTSSSTTYGESWALEDTSLGWNTRELVSLYFHNSELQTQWAWEALSNYHFRGNENVLDFGSGDGKLSALISFMVPEGKVTGFDISEEMIYYATKMFPSYHYKNLAFHLSSDVDFSDVISLEKFDLVTSFCVFHFVPNPTTVLRNIRYYMAPEGHLVMTLPIGGNVDFFRAASEEMAIRKWNYPSPTGESRQMRNPDKVQEVLAAAGFDITYFKVVNSRFPFSSKEEMIDWFEGTLAANWNIPKQSRREFFTALADRYLQYQPEDADEDGFVYFSQKRIDLVATPNSN